MYGLEYGGVCLVRPDGYIAWRSGPDDDHENALAAALSQTASATQAAATQETGVTQ